MPRSTVKHGFEFAILGWATALPAPRNTPVFVILDEAGNITETALRGKTEEEQDRFRVETLPRLKKERHSGVFWDPFDWPVYAYLEWQNVSQGAFERLIGRPFLKKELPPPANEQGVCEFPTSWGVMF
jgi:hypothetical protein